MARTPRKPTKEKTADKVRSTPAKKVEAPVVPPSLSYMAVVKDTPPDILVQLVKKLVVCIPGKFDQYQPTDPNYRLGELEIALPSTFKIPVNLPPLYQTPQGVSTWYFTILGDVRLIDSYTNMDFYNLLERRLMEYFKEKLDITVLNIHINLSKLIQLAKNANETYGHLAGISNPQDYSHEPSI